MERFGRKHATQIPLAPAPSELKVGDPWTEENKRRLLGFQGAPSPTLRVLEVMNYESPLMPNPIVDPLSDQGNFSDSQGREIAMRCKSDFSEPWDRIGCVSKAVNVALKNVKFPDKTTFCRNHAQAFNVSFAGLGIRRALSKTIGASGGWGEGHVVNLIIVTSPTGQTFSYAMDSGNLPQELFPQNDAAIRFHDRDGDGRTDFFGLPAIGVEPAYQFKPVE